MKITVTGATGFLGRRVIKALRAHGHSPRILSRRASTSFGKDVPVYEWDPMAGSPPESSLSGSDAILHLAGEPVAQRWTEEAKRLIRDSRVIGTGHLVQGLSTLSPRPQTLVCASAVGYYGDRDDRLLTENSKPGKGFLSEVCVEWERQADLAEALGMRVVKIRIGVVLGREGGALAKMLPPFRAGVGGPIGGGKQWMSWIHVDDLVNLMVFALENPIRGPVNGVAPYPVTNAEFTRALGKTLHRPAILPVPGFAVKLLFGEMASTVLSSQRVQAQAAQQANFRFQFPEIDPALADILK